ncbi:hypothetical protein ACFQE8_08835 [Salinirubellus sp. GCM10025818]|uniref:hypothetical protein n=1 Tax=Salinirubellus TaxID=2162630 RepID=UPI0030D1B2FB
MTSPEEPRACRGGSGSNGCPPASGGDSADPIAFEDLPEAEREIVRTALKEGEYVVESDRGSPAFESLRDRIEGLTGDGETPRVYLRRGETYSSVWNR